MQCSLFAYSYLNVLESFLKLYGYMFDTSICSCRYFYPKPKFFYLDDLDGTVCHILLPSNSPLHLIVSTPQTSRETAKKDACLKAVEELHKMGAINDYLLPMQENVNPEEPVLCSSDSDSCEG